MNVTSAAFGDQERIPRSHTCDGDDRSPPLTIEEVPDDAVSLALLVDDPDAPGGTFTHWVAWKLAAGGGEIPEGASGDADFEEGTNDFDATGWRGPCPPEGRHHYRFRVFALDEELELPSGAGRSELEEALDGHVVEEARLVGLYGTEE